MVHNKILYMMTLESVIYMAVSIEHAQFPIVRWLSDSFHDLQLLCNSKLRCCLASDFLNFYPWGELRQQELPFTSINLENTLDSRSVQIQRLMSYGSIDLRGL